MEIELKQNASVKVNHTYNAGDGAELMPRGRFHWEHWRGDKCLRVMEGPNGITNEGKNALLNIMFHGSTQITTWWLGLIDSTGYTALAAGDTYDNINQAGNGWDEFTAYTISANATDRGEWPEGAAASQSITNASPVQFDITSPGTVKGSFVVGGSGTADTKEDHTAGATLWATALFNEGDVAVLAGDALKLTYTVSC